VEWYWAAALMVGMVLVLMALGFPVAIAFLGANAVGVYLFMGGWVGLEQLVGSASDSLSSFILVTVPLFILMGNIFYHSGVAVRVFDALDALFGRLPGRLSYVTVAGGTLFAALSGSAMANAAMMGSLMVPEMIRRGYHPRMAMGPIMGCAGLAILIPPSALAVLLGSLAQINVGALLIAGIGPGLVLAVLYAMLIWLQLKRDPAAAPVYEIERKSPGETARLVVKNIAPMGIVVFCVVGLIVIGLATPTEAAAFGVLGTLIVVAMFRKLTWNVIYKSLESSLNVTVMVFFILLGSFTFSQVFAFSGATEGLIRWATGFQVPPIVIVLIMIAILLVLGCFIDGISMLLITLPVFMPLAVKLG
jgi:tripartite ATP-independent transporter DctM subunit